ncbi:TPA: hypothetical protein EYP12_06185, partial [Candidatus Bipolaricaulota bacterium]|nr:hypothetical protein [Candidatus Bipolaricaulota bacterium]
MARSGALRVEAEEETVEEQVLEILKSEVNLLIFPLFFLSKRGRGSKIEYRAEIQRGGEKIELLWQVTPHPEYGSLGVFDKKVFKAIEYRISKMGFPIRNPIPFSIYEICKEMGFKRFGGTEYEKVKDSLKRITVTPVESRGTFYSKAKEGWIDEVFHLYERVIFKGERLPDGATAETNYLYLGSWYLENLNALYIRPLNYRYYRSLRNVIARRLYELLGVKFYGIWESERHCIRYRYSTLCQLLPLARQWYLSLAKQQLEPAHAELIDTDFLSEVEWREIPSEDDEKDWLISYFPGPRVKEEIAQAKGRLEGREPARELPPPSEAEDEAFIKGLARAMVEALEDEESYPFYRKLATLCLERPLLEDLVYQVLSEVKDEYHRGKIRKSKGALFTDKIKRYCQERGIDLGLKPSRAD